MSDLPPHLRARILEATAARPSPTRLSYRWRRGLRVAVVVLLLGLFAFQEPLALAHRPLAHAVIMIGTSLVMALLTGAWVLTPGSSSLGRPRESLHRLAVMTPIVLAVGMLMGTLSAPGRWRAPASDLRVHVACAISTVILGALVLVVLLSGERGSDPVAPGVTGRSIGALAGAWGVLAVSIECPHVDPGHVLVAHIVPVILLILTGSYLGSRWLALR